MSTQDLEKMSKEEFDVDTGSYMEDVRGNDFIGIDKDGDGLIDNVEKLVEEAEERAREYNEERERLARERREKEAEEGQGKDGKDRDSLDDR